MTYAPARPRSRAPWLAFLLVPLIALAGLLVPQTAHADTGPQVTAEVTAASEASGLAVRVQGAGFDGIPGAYAAIIEKDDEAAFTHTSGYAAFGFWADQFTGDAFDKTLTAPADKLDPAVQWEVIVWPQHTQPTTDTIYARTDVSVTDAQWDAIFPPPAPPTPTLAVSKTSDLDPEGDTITITGTDYDTTAIGMYGPTAGVAAGFYIQIGWIDENWRPSEGAPSSSRSNAYTVWVQENLTTDGYLAWTRTSDTTADFTWTVDIDKATLDAKTRDGATLAVFTVGAGGPKQAANEHAIPITFTTPPTPTLAVSKTSDLDPEGDTITITGTDYDTTAIGMYGPTAGVAAGFYIQIGWIDENWRPSEGAPSSSRSNAYTVWVQENLTTDGYLAWTRTSDTTADFTWTVDIDKATLDAKTRDGATLAVFTVGAGGPKQAANEHAIPITFTEPTTQEPGTDPGTTPPPALTAGSLSWGIKSSFRTYVTSPIAHGSITTSGVSTVLGNFVFPQSGAAQLTNGIGSVAYSGSVRFAGHGGELDLRLSDPQVRIDSATNGTLFVRVNGGTRVAFATLALASGTKATDATGAVQYVNVPATLTSAGAAGFNGFYGAGTALDPVSFVAGSPGSTSVGTVVVASAGSRTVNTPDATPPATEGIRLTAGEPVEGGEVTAEAEGFQANESGILAVIYSEPTVLAENLTADAEGHVTWSGALPRGLTGTHTLTFQGSVDRGVVLEIAAASELQCTVSDASLEWGFKEAFRAYIDGSIANGEWTTDGDVSYATPLFTWANGTGGAEDDALDVQFSGAVRFTGHGGVLDTTIANPRVVIDGDRAVLLLDVHGTTQAGDAVEQAGVEFAELDLEAATRTQDGEVLTLTEVPAILTAAGAAAFGTYPEGEPLDALTITATVDGGCGSEVETPSAAPVDDELETEQTSDTGWPVWATVLIVLLLAAAIAVVVTVLVRRRRA